MKIVFSRKGFDSGSGGRPSPIVDGVPVSLPIPSGPGEPQRYRDLVHPLAGDIGPVVARTTGSRIGPAHFAHADPVLPLDPGPAALGQTGAAQGHLANQGVGPGDVFIFFGLFRDGDLKSPDRAPHHRIFGLMRVDGVRALGDVPDPADPAHGIWRNHPHVIRRHNGAANTLWTGTGQLAGSAHPGLRLTRTGAAPSLWSVPGWLTRCGLSYHGSPQRWGSDGSLHLVARGQEFVSDTGDDPEAREWLRKIESLLALR